MRIRHAGESRDTIQLQMTPMIDIVFLLLVFFIMTFKIVAQEGDLNVKMPLASQQSGDPVDSPLTMHVRLRAASNGALLSSGGIVVNGERVFDTADELHNYVVSILGGDEPSAREDAEVELDCDYDLHYKHVIEATTAVMGYVDEKTGQVERLIDNIKLTPPPELLE